MNLKKYTWKITSTSPGGSDLAGLVVNYGISYTIVLEIQ